MATHVVMWLEKIHDTLRGFRIAKLCRSRIEMECSRREVIEHAVKCLTTERRQSTCLQPDYIKDIWDQVVKKQMIPESFSSEQIKRMDDVVKEWELLHDSQIERRKPSDLTVCYLGGSNLLNDLQLLIQKGVLCRNVWVVAKDSNTKMKIWNSVGRTGFRNVRLYASDFLSFLKDFKGQFDIIYFDPCTSLAKENALKLIRDVFYYNKLTSLGAFITVFSFPLHKHPVEHEDLSDVHFLANESEGKENNTKKESESSLELAHEDDDSFRSLSGEEGRRAKFVFEQYLRYRVSQFDAKLLSKRNDKENYGDYITFKIIDSASLVVPVERMLTATKNTVWKEIFINKGGFLDEILLPHLGKLAQAKVTGKLPGEQSQVSGELSALKTVQEETDGESHLQMIHAVLKSPNRSNSLCKTWVDEIFPDWKTSPLNKYDISLLPLTPLMFSSHKFIRDYSNSDFKEKCLDPLECSKSGSLHGPCTECLVANLLYGQLANPSFPVVDKLLRLRHTSKGNEVFSHVFIFDKCEYVYDQFPTIEGACYSISEPLLQMAYRMALDGLKEHLGSVSKSLFQFCDQVGSGVERHRAEEKAVPSGKPDPCSDPHREGEMLLRKEEDNIEPRKETTGICVQFGSGVSPPDSQCSLPERHVVEEKAVSSDEADPGLEPLLTKEEDNKKSHMMQVDCARTEVPSEIKARGRRAKLVYENALKTGKVKVNRARIMLIGQDRAGKTSLKKSFLGLPFDPGEESTDGIEVWPSKFEVDIDRVKNWKRTDKKWDVSQFADDLAKIVAQELQENADDEEGRDKEINDEDNEFEKERDVNLVQFGFDDPRELQEQQTKVEPLMEEKLTLFDSQMNQGTSSKADEKETNTAVPTDLKIDRSLPPEEFMDHLVEHLKSLNLQSDTTAVERHMTLDLWDFAGHHLYYASYPVFLSPRAVYMLVYDLSKGLKETAKPCFRQGVRDILLDNPNNETNLENLLSWLVSVSSICSSEPDVSERTTKLEDLPYVRPPVFIVGTHADEPHQDIKEMELQIQREISGKDYERHVIRPFYSVDNTQGSSDEGVVALQKRMIQVLKQEPYMGQEVPIRWFNFEKVVQALIAGKVHYLHLEQLQSIIQKVCFIEDEDEVATLLNFYHDLGIIVRHRNTVILQAQWLIEVFKQLITIRSFDEMEPRHSKFWKEMETTGALHMELVDHVFSKYCQQGLIKEDILNMMEQFGLIAKSITTPTNEMYFVPCQLKTPPEALCEMEPSPSDPLYLHFVGGFVPHGFFLRLVSRITKWCSKSGFTQLPRFFLAASRFVIKKKSIHQLILLCKKRFIKIVLTHSGPVCRESFSEAQELAILVRMFSEKTVRDLRRELPWLGNLKFSFCVGCPGCLREEMCSYNDVGCCDNEDYLYKDELLSHWPRFRLGYHPGTDYVYNMTARPRGITLIINNASFAHHRKHGQQSPRLGSEEDVRQVEALFTALGFSVRTKENLSRLQLLGELYDVACRDHSAYDCFVLWLMSHGRSGEVFCSDGDTVPIQTLHDMFSHCYTLRGKPKLFFIQVCRGDGEDEGVSFAADIGISSYEQLSPNQLDFPIDEVKKPASRVPTQADFLCAFSTVDEYISYRHEALGSYHVRGLVEAFRERAVNDHLLDILTVVNKKVSNMEAKVSSVENKNEIKILKQMPRVEHTLRKQVRF